MTEKPDMGDHVEQRTLLATERTYTAWVRTGLAALVAGIGFERFIPGTIPGWSVRLIAVILIVFSIGCFWLALWRYRHLGLRFPDLLPITIPLRLITVLTLSLILTALLTLIGLWSD